MAGHFFNIALLIFFFSETCDEQKELMAGNTLPAPFLNSLMAFCTLLLIVIFGHLIYLRGKVQRRKASREGRNHPAIPSPVYETLQTPEPTKGMKGKASQQMLSPQPAAPPGQDELPDAYSFYTQLDRLEED